MRVTTERLENCQVNVIIEMDAADIEEKLRETARKLSRRYNIPGYRRGKAPYHAVMRVFGREAVQQQALEDFGQDLYDQALEQVEYEPYEIGELQDVEWDPFRMTVLLPVQPEVELGEYRAVRVSYEPQAVTDEDVEERLKELQQQNAQWVPVERPAALGDQVLLDLEVKVGDQVILDNQGREMLLEAESKSPLPGFHEEIVGLSSGQEKSFVLTVPEDGYEAEVAGQEATVTVHLLTVRQEDLPGLDDDLAMMVGDYDSLDGLRTAIRQSLETEAQQRAESEYLDQVLEAMIEAATKIEYPPQAVAHEVEVALGQMERNLATSGMQLDTFLGMIGKTREAYREELRPSADERLKKRLVLREIAQLEGLEPESEEVEAEIERLSEMLGPQGEELRQMLDSPEGRQSVADDLIMTRAQERVVQIGKGEAPPKEDKEEAVAEAVVETEAEGEVEAGAEAETPAAEEPVAEQALAEPLVGMDAQPSGNESETEETA